MKKWKTVVVVVVIVALVVSLIVVANYALEDKSIRAAKARIKNMRIVAEEQALIRQILEDKITVAKIQAQFTPPATPAPPVPDNP